MGTIPTGIAIRRFLWLTLVIGQRLAPPLPAHSALCLSLLAGLLLTDGDFWHEQRRFVLRQLKEFGFGRRTMAALVQDEASELVRAFEDKLRASPTGAIAPMHDAFGESPWSASRVARDGRDGEEVR